MSEATKGAYCPDCGSPRTWDPGAEEPHPCGVCEDRADWAKTYELYEAMNLVETPHGQLMLGVLPDPDPDVRWDGVDLPTWRLHSAGLTTDVMKNAKKNADVTGIPQRIVRCYDQTRPETWEIEILVPDFGIRKAIVA